MEKYYARYANTGALSDVCIFHTKEKRDSWVNFSDQFSIEVGETKQDHVFDREAVDYHDIEWLLHREDVDRIPDWFDSEVEWVLGSRLLLC